MREDSGLTAVVGMAEVQGEISAKTRARADAEASQARARKKPTHQSLRTVDENRSYRLLIAGSWSGPTSHPCICPRTPTVGQGTSMSGHFRLAEASLREQKRMREYFLFLVS